MLNKVLRVPCMSQDQTRMSFLIPCIIAFEIPAAAAVNTSRPELDGTGSSIYNGCYTIGGTVLCAFHQEFQGKQFSENRDKTKTNECESMSIFVGVCGP